jgi:hypothetical protein
MTKPRPAVWPSRIGAGSGPASPPQRAAPTETPAPAETATIPAGPAPAVVIPAVAVSAPYELSILGKIHGRARGGEPARCTERRGLRPGTEGDDDCRCKSNQSITHTISSPDVSHRSRHSAPPVRLRQTNHNEQYPIDLRRGQVRAVAGCGLSHGKISNFGNVTPRRTAVPSVANRLAQSSRRVNRKGQ